MDNTEQLFLLFGLHRSGSSATAGIVHFLGVDMGQNEGLFENLDFVLINEEILWESGGAWDSPPDNHSIVGSNYTKSRIHTFLAANSNLVWGLKDPRLLLTFDVWKPYIKQHRKVTYIFIHRPFIASVKSLTYRDQLSLTKSTEILAPYLQNFYRHRYALAAEGEDIVDVYYDQLVQEVRPFVSEINLRLHQPPEHNTGLVQEWVHKDLKRF